MSRAQDLFERIRDGGIRVVEEMVADEVTEELFLDYKIVSTAYPAHKLSDSDRKNLAKAISGFANSDGGIIVWGVNCRPGEGRGDVPSSVVSIPNVKWFKTLIDGAISGMTLPPHSGVETVAISESATDEGVVVTHVPVGYSVPLWSVAEGTRNYYIRAGSNFVPVPHGVLAGLFGRRPQPQLHCQVGPLEPQPQALHPSATVKLNVLLLNTGRGSAEDAFVIIDSEHDRNVKVSLSKFDSDQWSARQSSGMGRYTLISAPGFLRIPPGDRMRAVVLELKVNRPVSSDLLITGTCGCSEAPGSAFALTLPARTLNRVAELLTHKFADENEQKLCIEEAFGLLKTPIS
ncbi:ATP-binding protein [Nostoc sp. XA013]|nr:ATP-binding protein [Nostoc sp. XA013]